MKIGLMLTLLLSSVAAFAANEKKPVDWSITVPILVIVFMIAFAAYMSFETKKEREEKE